MKLREKYLRLWVSCSYPLDGQQHNFPDCEWRKLKGESKKRRWKEKVRQKIEKWKVKVKREDEKRKCKYERDTEKRKCKYERDTEKIFWIEKVKRDSENKKIVIR